MKPVDVIGSQPGRVLRVVAGSAMIDWGLRRGDAGGRAAAAAGVVPLAAGAADVCLLGPLVHGPGVPKPAGAAPRGRPALTPCDEETRQ
ncbi:MAG: hypothetical protein WD794_08545 [Mycobacteriales bacterium]